MQAFFHGGQSKHDPIQAMNYGRIEPAKDSPKRVFSLLNALRMRGIAVKEPNPYGLAPILRVHDSAYVEFLRTLWRVWEELPEKGEVAWPSYFPYANGRAARRSRGPCPTQALKGKLGWFLGDMSAPVGPFTFLSAVHSTETAVSAADAILAGGHLAYALCRPSGHHARTDRASGLCYLNNSAIAAERLLGRHKRVAILDIDAHHGDGTEQIFYQRCDVLTVSIHADPSFSYPFYTGFADHLGEEEGRGFNLNIPLSIGSKLPQYERALDAAAAAISDFSPDVLVIGLGFDALGADPVKLLALDTADFSWIGAHLASLGKPMLLVQEGGYAVDAIGDGLLAFLDGLGKK